MSAALKSLGEVLEPVLQQLSPVLPSNVPRESASAAVAAEQVRASRGLPAQAIAIRSGLAVNSLDLVGASPQSPVVLSSRPCAVLAGAPLPQGCDAVIHPASVVEVDTMLLASDAATPGMNARLEGQDLFPDAVILTAGQRMTPEAMLACRLAGIVSIPVRQPRITVTLADERHAVWIGQRLSALGCVTSADEGHCDVAISDTSLVEPRLALHPGDTAWIALAPDGAVHVKMPARFDGVIASYAALVLPVVARLAGLGVRASRRPLTRKVSSSIGLTELALLQTVEAGYEPLAVGDVTLAAVAQADAFMLIQPAAEGHAAGETVAAIRLSDPFGLGPPEGSP